MTDSRPDAVVLGAGVIGLTTAICLAESGRRVLVRGADEPAHTTSAAAGAMVGPASSPPESRAWAWEQETIAVFTGFAGDPGTGVRLRTGAAALA